MSIPVVAPGHAAYLDEADVRGELARTFDVCQGCRRCVEHCSAFPTLFDLLDTRRGHDAGLMTPAEQDEVVDECHHCGLCAVGCPYPADVHGDGVDVPRLMLRATAMQRAQRITRAGSRRAARVLGRIDAIGSIGVRIAPLANRVIGAPPASMRRRIVATLTGVSAGRPLPRFGRERFSTWFRRRPAARHDIAGAAVTVYPTCVVEYHAPGIGRDLVRVYERNGIRCSATRAGCCGAPSLYAGDLDRFARIARRTTKVLAAEVRAGADIVVAQPGCVDVLTQHYPDHLADPAQRRDAELVAAHTFDAAEYLMTRHGPGGDALDTDFAGTTFGRIVHHVPPRPGAREGTGASTDLMALTGASVDEVPPYAGVDGPWDLRRDHDERSTALTDRVGGAITAAGGDVVAGDSALANSALTERIGRLVLHPFQVIALAYGIEDEA